MSHDEQTEQTRRVVRDYLDALQRGDLDALRASFTTDATWSLGGALPVSGTWTGPEGIIDGFLAAMVARLDTDRPLTQEVTGLVVDGGTAVAEWTSRATTTSGRAYENDYAVVFEVREGQIAAVREYFDTAYAGRVLFSAQAPLLG
ncbi:MAG TPA: nuclear transport factor 2 family protein [Nocardioides sp.]|uniref:nuclear transport factor 2 family protein n=1 Tax=Nocardioides sp. TaxID=35761 RepID=UPI002E32AE36|nr:nuclear transport factor 2 family protein [Nocardioides sp.]HEX5087147.1 nuclear transport factor 2 family protein [Nocardioides sp.]